MHLSHTDVLTVLLGVAVLLLAARLLGELAASRGLPVVVGELLTGVLLGPTVFGALLPEWQAELFPREGGAAVLLDGLTMLAVTLFFFAAGLEVTLSTVWRQGRAALAVGVGGMAVPFALGFGAAWVLPEGAVGPAGVEHPVGFALILGTVVSVTAVAVVARILMDMNLYRTDLGTVLVAGSLLNDLIAWVVVSLAIGAMGLQRGVEPVMAVALTVAFTVAMLTVVRQGLRRALPWVQAHTSWPAGVLGLGLGLALLAAALTEAIGVHPVFGAFMAGVALGDSPHLRERSRFAVRQFISIFFAPLFFTSIGLHTDFVTGFDPVLVVVIAALASVGKLLGTAWAARWVGMDRRSAWSAGVGMNARGSMDLILALLAVQLGIFDTRLFVAIVVVGLVSAIACGPLLAWLLRVPTPRHFMSYLRPRAFVPQLLANDAGGAIDELAHAAARATGLDAVSIAEAVRAHEAVAHTGLGRRLAVPHARLPGLPQPVLALGLSETGIDFDAPDDLPTRIVVLLLIPADEPTAQLDLLRDVVTVLGNESLQRRILTAKNHVELASLIRSRGEEAPAE